MKRSLAMLVAILFLAQSTAFASSKADVVKSFSKLDAMLEVGTSRNDIQNQLVVIKMALNELGGTGNADGFTKRAGKLFEEIRMCFTISDLMPTGKSGATAAHEALQEGLPDLKRLAQGKP